MPLLAGGLWLAACGGLDGGQAGPAEQPAADVTAGAAAYQNHGCVRCHGEQALGGRGGALAPVRADRDAWVASLRRVHREYGPSVLSDADARAIHAWLTALR